ncbi:MAG: glycosyltransferase [Candidatus Tumulicola sp.]
MPDERRGSNRLAALVWATDLPEYWVECVRALQAVHGISEIILATSSNYRRLREIFSDYGVELRDEISLASALSRLDHDIDFDEVLVIHLPVVLPPEALTRASSWMRNDPRIGTVSFLSNSSGYLSFPVINGEIPVPRPEGHDQSSITAMLRSEPDSGPVPITVPEGGAVVIGKSALSVAGVFSDFDLDPKVAIADFALRANTRGFGNYLDAGTYIYQPWEPIRYRKTSLVSEESRSRLHARHHYYPNMQDRQITSMGEPLRIALDLAITKVSGLRVLIDGSSLGPIEMGTQVTLVALINSLADNEKVAWLGVGLQTETIPAYARATLLKPKVNIVKSDNLHFSSVSSVDILHRPYQPEPSIPWHRWRAISKRIVITIHDLIAFRTGAYFEEWDAWMAYREAMRQGVATADAVLVISKDVLGPIHEECLPISAERLFVVPNGIDHIERQLAAHPPAFPRALEKSALVAAEFAFVLGATYAHKNRDLSIRVWRELRRRGHGLSLIMAGAIVPHGSTRFEEATMLTPLDEVLILPDISSEERNWFMSHASLILYLTSAEGFGMLPFEAAQFGKPALHVSFGPLRELMPYSTGPVDWRVSSLADHAEKLLLDPLARQQAVARVLDEKRRLTWADNACGAISAYQKSLASPRRTLQV